MCLLCVDSDINETHDVDGPLTWDMFATACQAVGVDTETGLARLYAQVTAAITPPDETAPLAPDSTDPDDDPTDVVKTIRFRQPDGTLISFRQPVAKARTPILNPQRFVLGVAYPADRVDGHGEFIRPDELEQRAWDYVRKGRQVGFFHADETTGHVEIVESYIYRGPDWETTDIDGQAQVIKSGDWMLGGVCDEPGWGLVVNGPADGWSIDGVAKRRTVPRSSVGKARP